MGEAEAAPVDGMSFEGALAELEAVVHRLESGEALLDESIALYARGADLRRHCEEKLKAAEEQVSRIVQGPDGTVAIRPFDTA